MMPFTGQSGSPLPMNNLAMTQMPFSPMPFSGFNPSFGNSPVHLFGTQYSIPQQQQHFGFFGQPNST